MPRYPSYVPKFRLRHPALILTLQSLIFGAPVISAQVMAQGTAQQSAPSQQLSFAIPAGPLAAALDHFARAAGVNLTYNASLVSGIRSSGLTGRHTVENALDKLLLNTGLEAVTLTGGGYSLRQAPAKGDIKRLKTVQVKGQNDDRGIIPYVAGETSSLGFVLSEQKTPAVINTVKEAFWEATASKTLDEVLSYVPGVSLTDNGGWTGDTIAIRGFLSSMPYRDGMRQADSGYGQSLRAMPDNIERIEIVKGPAGAEFGVAEPGGAVNFITKQPLREKQGRLTLGIGQDGYRKAGADMTGGISPEENVQARLVLAYMEPEEWRSGRPDDTYRYLVAPSVNWDYSTAGKLTLGFERNYQNAPQDRGIIYLEGAWPGGFAPREWSFHQTSSKQVNKTERFYLHHRHEFHSSLTWTTAIERGTYEYDLAEFRNAETEPGWGDLYNDDGLTWSGVRTTNLFWDKWRGDTTANAFRSTLAYSFNVADVEQVLSFGVDGSKSTNIANSLYSDINNTLDILAPVNNQQPQILREDYALWESTINVREEGIHIKWLANWSEHWRTILGVRRYDYTYDYDADYTDFTDSTNNYPWVDNYGSSKTSFRLATSYDLNDQHTFFAGFSEGYVPQTGVTSDEVPVNPIHDRAVELGMKSRLLDGKLSWTNSLFGTKRAGVSLNDPANGPNQSFVINGGESRIYGIESELNAQLGHYLLVRAGLALQQSRILVHQTEDFEGNRFANTPEQQVSLMASYNWGGMELAKLTTDLGFTHIGQRWGNSGNNISLPSYTLVSLGAAYQLADQTSLRLSIANATDETYYTGMQDSGARADQVMVGFKRNSFLTLTHEL